MRQRIHRLFATSALMMLLGSLPLAWLASLPAEAQQAPPPAPPPATTTVSGTVDFFMLGSRGQVNGLLLRDNTIVRFAPQLGPEIVRNVRPGDVVTATGFFEAAGQMHATSIRDATSLRTISETTATPAPPEKQLLETTGTIRVVTRNSLGLVDGVVMTNGIVVRIPPDVAARFAAQLQPGQPLAVRGWATINEYGRTLDADAFGPSLDQLYSIRGNP
jgi:hypothetical protein